MKYLGLIFLILVLSVCKNKSHTDDISIKETYDLSASQDSIASKYNINYHLVPVKDSIRWLRSIISDDTLRVLFAINRVDKKHFLRQDTLVFPDTFLSDLMRYSPFPKTAEILKPIHKIIFYSYPIQAFAAYQNGELIRWGPVSMGKQSTPTPSGLLYTNWRSKRAISTIDPDWIMNWYFNLENKEGVSMHEYDLPGYPASHACVRLSADDAFWLYNWADQWKLASSTEIAAYGTPVIVFGAYPFGQRKPWRYLEKNSEALTLTEEKLKSEVQKYLPLILQRQAQRDSCTSM